MKLLITGASGFVGRHVVGEALERGHRVWAIVRPGSDLRNVAWAEHAGVTVAPLDLRQPAGLEELIAEVDAVVHLAAVMRGDIEAQRTGTVATTENLLKAMAETVGRRLVLVSSLSVYDYRRIAAFTELDEGSPIEEHPEEREAYCWAKLLQEDLVRRYGREHDLAITILRLGVVIGPDRTWTDQLGLRVLSWLWIRFTAARAPIPLTYVENCAAAILMATESTAAVGETFNVVDDDLPTRGWYARELRRRETPRPRVLVLPGTLVRAIARGVWNLNELLFAGRIRLPWFANPAKLDVQLKPLRFSHARISRVLGWEPRFSLTEALDRCFRPT